ncbi:hypothetical protein FZD47_20665 [Bacillus infantis]|uniref:Beta-ketoacyl-[acyl-carrier-protein] synthase III C-terminal domain-containing protein n=1 Tax=Bacillus infantis TaxID=324767 RepID=A0A5D4SAI2_9BACI|nr:3-oxoacyl-[acyl-carrier-protein] synthase III C-terminal domain-containing protein [Bacillus infantis]TYS60623.1 hypothetical protein FZD47_20665 [Bacillus infantis]
MELLIRNSVYLPNEKKDTIEESAESETMLKGNANNIKKRGMYAIPVDDESSGLDMLYKALDPILYNSDLDLDKIKYIIIPNSFHPPLFDQDIIKLIKDRYELINAIGFSLMDRSCSSYLMGFEMGQTFLKRSLKTDEFILVVSIQKVTNPHLRYSGDALVRGDSAVASILGKQPGSVGSQIMAVTNLLHTYNTNLAEEDDISGPIYWEYSHLKNLSKVLKMTLDKANIQLEQIKLIIPNNTIVKNWNQLAKLMKFPSNKFFLEGLDNYGYMNNCDLILNYELALKRNLLHSGDHFVLISFGLGGTIGCAVLKKE